MRKRYPIILILVVAVAGAYSLLNTKLYADDLQKSTLPENIINKSHIEDVFNEKNDNGTMQNGTGKGKFILLDNTSGGGFVGGVRSGGCSGTAFSQHGDYYVKSRIISVENVQNGESVITYTYAVVDEYDKMNQSMPDLNPGNIVIVSSLNPPGGEENPDNPFMYTYLEKTVDGFSFAC